MGNSHLAIPFRRALEVESLFLGPGRTNSGRLETEVRARKNRCFVKKKKKV